MTGYKSHLFICTNSPDKSGKCGSKGSEEMRRRIKEKCQNEYGKSVRINASGCLGYCEQGIAAVLYSENKPAQWLMNLTNDQDEKLLELVKQSIK